MDEGDHRVRQQEFRHHVLALLLVSDQFCAAASTMLVPRYFDNPAEQHMCRFVLEYYREYHKAPKRMPLQERAYTYFNTSKHLAGQLEDFDLLLNVVTDLDKSAANQSEYIRDSVREFCREQALKDALLKSVDDIQAGKFEEVSRRVQEAMGVGAEMDGRGIYLLQDADDRQTIDEVRDVIPSGSRWLDEPTRGGLARGELLIVMAPPNTGKTTTLINLGVGVLKNRHKVAHFTCEMSKGIVRAKYDQCLLKKTDAQLNDLDNIGKGKIAEWMKTLQKNLRSDVYIQDFPPNRLTMDMLRAQVMLMKSRDGFIPDYLLVDYMDIMKMPEHIKDLNLQLAWLGVELRALAKELNVGVATVTQTNRSGSTKETAMGDDVSGDFTKVATSDFLVSMNQTLKEVEEEMCRMFWIKNRLGVKHKSFKMMTDFERSLLVPA